MLWVVSSLLHRVRKRAAWLFSVLAGMATLISASLFALTQHVSWFIGIYWAVVTVTTVGYGDVVPKNTTGRILAITTMLVVIPLVGVVFADWAAAAASIHIRRLLGMHSTSGTLQHLVILGYTPLIPHLLPDLLAAHPAIVLVADIALNQVPEEEGMHFIAGDPSNPHVLAKANLQQARQIVVVGDTDGDVLMTAIEAQHLVPGGPILAVTHAAKAVLALKAIGIEGIATQDLMGELITQSLATPHAAMLLQALLSSEATQLQEMVVPKEWVGSRLSAVRAQPEHVILGVVQAGQFHVGLPDDPVLTADTTVIQLGLRPAAGTKGRPS